MTYDVEKVKTEISEQDRREMLESMRASKDVPAFVKTAGGRFEEVWVSGCWLTEKLKGAEASEEEVYAIGFVHGQRSVFGNPYRWAAALFDEFVETGTTKDRPGNELADRINDENMQVGGGLVAVIVEDPK